MNRLFAPVSIIAGLIAGQLSKRIFVFVWGKVADEEAPSPKHSEILYSQLLVALIVEGALQRLVRGLVDHGTRKAWAKRTGEWPGEEQRDPK